MAKKPTLEQQLRRALAKLLESQDFSSREYWISKVADLEVRIAKAGGYQP